MSQPKSQKLRDVLPMLEQKNSVSACLCFCFRFWNFKC